ncbi:ankyrin repeat-containing domain protein [Pelagophyceae sp. CCMP2097]|nr:ankyrin repeat-containing domain protein [Pelagophyceae sp. CCMP2097]|mmetsp:Transcript_4796/g.15243  ORF Transcript_4796/g.15243 Transcript_4796/m.15243 type:complete len:140 (-) Transcript_4796:38-457(-)
MADEDNLWTAASDGDVGRVIELLDSGAHAVDDADDSGYTCLHAAASYSHRGLIEALIARKANVHAVDDEGETPLHVCEDTDTAKLLIAAGADAAKLNTLGQTAEDRAREEDFPILADFLATLAGPAETAVEASTKKAKR